MSIREQATQQERAMRFALKVRSASDKADIFLESGALDGFIITGEDLRDALALSYEYENLLKQVIDEKYGNKNKPK